MKKYIRLFGLFIVMLVCLTACGQKHNENVRYKNLEAYIYETDKNDIYDLDIEQLDKVVEKKDKTFYYYKVHLVYCYFIQSSRFYRYTEYNNGDYEIEYNNYEVE